MLTKIVVMIVEGNRPDREPGWRGSAHEAQVRCAEWSAPVRFRQGD